MNKFLEKEIHKFLYKHYAQNLDKVNIKMFSKENITYLLLENLEEKSIHQKLEKEIKLFISSNFPEIEFRVLFSNIKNIESKKKIRLAKKIILITSCKGGVGKSTISSLIAQKLAFTHPNKKIALLDGDIYGPSIHQIFNISDKPEIIDNKMIPILKHNVWINSIGMIIGSDQALTVRAPIANKTLFKIFSLTHWNNPDFLVIDTPPGTGDIHLNILQNYIIDHVILITTPQKLSEIDAVRTIRLYEKFHLPITSIIENMSYLEINNLKQQIFYGDSAEKLKNIYKISHIDKIAILPEISKYCDLGKKLTKFFSAIDIHAIQN